MTINNDAAKQFERKLSSFADELHLPLFQCRMLSKKVAELEGQSLTPRQRRREFASWAQDRIQGLSSNFSNSKLPAITPTALDRNGAEYRVMRIYDETFGLRSSGVALIDSYFDQSKISAQRALQLIGFIKHAAPIKGPSSLLVHIKSCCKKNEITPSQAAALIDVMETLPLSLLTLISNWHAEKKISDRHAYKLIVLTAQALSPPGSQEGIHQEDLSFILEPEGMNAAAVDFETKLGELRSSKGLALRTEIIDLFTQVVHSVDKMDTFNKKAWFLYFHNEFMECLSRTNAAIKSECLNNWDKYLESQKFSSGSDVPQPVEPSFISRIEKDAYSYWLPRVYDEIYGDRSDYDRCVDELYDNEQLTMNTAKKILDLPCQPEDGSGDPYFRFSQKLCEIRHPTKTLPERFSEEAFKLILSHYN